MQIVTPITESEIAEEMRSDPEFGMELIAQFCQNLNAMNFVEQGAQTNFHIRAADKLREIADAIEEMFKTP